MSFKKIISVLLLSASITACDTLDFLGDKKEKPPLPGERISVLGQERSLMPDEEAKVSPFNEPAVRQNDSWPQAGGNPDHAMQNPSLSTKALQKAWSTSIGEGAKSRQPLTTQPIVAGKSVFTLDTNSTLASFSTEDGKRRWSVSVRPPEESDQVISGGIAYDNGVIYVTAGYDEVVAVDSQKGAILWRAALPSPSRAAPTINGGRLFITTINNVIVALNAADGKQEWEFSGLGESTGLVGAASPAIANDLVIPAFSSGELYALRTTNGSVAWSDNLSNSVRLGGMTGLSDIRGLPVVEGDAVYAISYGGKMAAIDIRTGARLWQKDISGAKTPWVAGNRVFVINTQSQIISLDKETGAVLWISQLARYKDAERKTGGIYWNGPVYAGGRLFAFSTDGRTAEVDPQQGTLVREWSTGKDVRIAPVIAGGTLYLLSEDGDLTAYR